MNRQPLAIVTGTVHRVHDAGRIVVVELTLAATLRGILLIDYPNGRQAALRWNPGDRVAAWGWGPMPNLDEPDAVDVVRAHTVQRLRPGQTAPWLNHRRRMTPRQRSRHDLRISHPHLFPDEP